ncbi:MAG: tetratricopeptide repeat protein [Bacteroidota bacterium]
MQSSSIRHATALLAGTLLLLCGLQVRAQTAATPVFDRGILEFRAGEYEAAAQTFDRVVEDDPENAEAYYMLARIYFETPLKNSKRADSNLKRALEIEPENVRYLVARLERLKEESSNFLVDRIRDYQRRQLSFKILGIDSTNAFAHEELGKTFIHDYWRYRNAISLPTLGLRETINNRQRQGAGIEEATAIDDAQDVLGDAGAPNIEQGLDVDPLQNFEQLELPIDDTFDIETLQTQGVPVQDLSRRADRAYARAVGHLKTAIENDPRRRSVYDNLMKIYALRGEHQEASDMLQSMYVFFPEDEDLWFFLGYNHHALGNYDAATKSFDVGLKRADGRVQNAFESLDLFLRSEEKKQYEEQPVEFASRYWTSQDPRFLTPYNERRLEHFSRLVYADLLYGSEALELRGWDTQRGQIIVRYGRPQSEVTLTGGFEAILRQLAESRDRTFQDPELDVQSPGSEVEDFDKDVLFNNTFNIWDYGDFRFVFEDPFRNNEYRLYSPPASWINGGGVDPWLNDYELIARATFKKTPERYDYEATGRQVDLPYLVTTFKGEDGTSDTYVHYGIPVQNYDPASELVNVDVNTGAFLINEQRDILVERRRKLYGLRTAQVRGFDEANLWIDTQPMAAPAGTHEVSVEFEADGGRIVGVQRREIEVPDYHDGNLALSDMLLAYLVEDTEDGKATHPGDIVRNNLSITPAPWSVYATTQPIYIYFEVYNLDLGEDSRSSYRVEAELVPKDTSSGLSRLVKRVFGSSDEGVSAAYDSGGISQDEDEYLILDAKDLEEGLYTLRLRVTDLKRGKSVDTEQDLFLE